MRSPENHLQGGLLNYVIMKVIISSHREILLDVQGSNIVRLIRLLFISFRLILNLEQWSGQQVQVWYIHHEHSHQADPTVVFQC